MPWGGAAAAAAAAAGNGPGYYSSQARRRPAKRTRRGDPVRALVVPGYTRTAGFYGRSLQARRRAYTAMAEELKWHDFSLNAADIGTTGGVLTPFNLIPEGTAENERIGRKCIIKSINLRWTSILTAAAGAAGAAGRVVRYIVVLDKQCNGAVPVWTDLMQDADYNSFRNLENQSRFTVFADKTYVLKHGAGAGWGDGTTNQTYWDQSKLSHIFYKKCNIPIEFSGATGAITEVRSNSLYLFIVDDGGSGGATAIAGRGRVRFLG